MDTNLRVLVANRPRLMRELVLSTLSAQAGIRVVGEATDEQDVPLLVAETKPDFLLIAGVPAAYAQQTSRREAIENSSCGHYRIARCGVEPDKLTVRN